MKNGYYDYDKPGCLTAAGGIILLLMIGWLVGWHCKPDISARALAVASESADYWHGEYVAERERNWKLTFKNLEGE